jgi:hypothetical protein
MNQLVAVSDFYALSLVVAAGLHAKTRFAEFFVDHLRNPNTRRFCARE